MKIWVQEYGSNFKIVKNMGLCNMGSFLKIRKYGSKQYGSISEKIAVSEPYENMGSRIWVQF